MPKLLNNKYTPAGKLRVSLWRNYRPNVMPDLKEAYQVFSAGEGKWYRMDPETGKRVALPDTCKVMRVHKHLAMDISTISGARAFYHFVTVYGYNKTRKCLTPKEAKEKIEALRKVYPDHDWPSLPKKSPRRSPRAARK